MENSDARDENDANGQKICDGSLDSEPAEPASRYRHPDEIGEGWRPCRDFLDPLADELEDWLHVSEAEGLDYGAEPSTLDSLMCILGGVMIVGGGGTRSAAWSRARAWFDVHGPAGFGDRFTSRVQAVWDEYESFDRQFGDLPHGQ